MPNLFVISGPNGAGKTTTHGKILSGERRVEAFVNADEIAAGIQGTSGKTADFRAGRLMLGRVDELAQSGKDLAFETTLSSRTLLHRVEVMLNRATCSTSSTSGCRARTWQSLASPQECVLAAIRFQ